MSSFKCANGHEWKIPRLTVGIIQDIQDACGINVYDAAEKGGELVALLVSPFRIAGILWVLCESQAKDRGVDERAFARGLTGEAIEQAGEGLVEAVMDFFPRAKVSTTMKAGLRNQMDRLDETLNAHLKSSFGGSSAASGSTPTS